MGEYKKNYTITRNSVSKTIRNLMIVRKRKNNYFFFTEHRINIPYLLNSANYRDVNLAHCRRYYNYNSKTMKIKKPGNEYFWSDFAWWEGGRISFTHVGKFPGKLIDNSYTK